MSATEINMISNHRLPCESRKKVPREGFNSLLGSSLTIDPNSLCDQLLTIDCARYTPAESNEVVCGTNKREYSNFCEFSRARCLDHNIDIFRVGSCSDPVTVAPTAATTPAIVMTTQLQGTTLDPTAKVFCSQKDQITCPSAIDLTCGVKGNSHKLYRNECEFNKERCDDLALNKADISACRN
ncbi:hypothetical protein FSP39_017046 [Pinctada imbricata]|uniref:Kazal-like domain-containing protein n=1 Tax=Pinctada imbricata TaxID=66713 RepID=A0AA88YSH2_PINIB|nr:hypothetical protein FSP39_017046 [Pinctada imbricata]